jgi:hypothetical protein
MDYIPNIGGNAGGANGFGLGAAMQQQQAKPIHVAGLTVNDLPSVIKMSR